MNWGRIEGNWKQVTGRAKAQWGKLSDDDLHVVAGRRDELAGKIQERYAVAKDGAERKLSDWEKQASDTWFAQADPGPVGSRRGGNSSMRAGYRPSSRPLGRWVGST